MLLLRGATGRIQAHTHLQSFNTCSSCEEQLFTGRNPGYFFCFNTCSSCEEQRDGTYGYLINDGFQYMLLLRGATQKLLYYHHLYQVSIHAPLARSNGFHHFCLLIHDSFNTCSSCEEQLFCLLAFRLDFFGFNTCSSCEEQRVSPHCASPRRSFNTCSSCEEQRLLVPESSPALPFQYMLLLRGATEGFFVVLFLDSCFNTCSSCEEQRAPCHYRAERRAVSIHAPLARSNVARRAAVLGGKFQYMLLLRGATCAMSSAV